MNIRKQIDEVIEGLSPGECIEALVTGRHHKEIIRDVVIHRKVRA
jgi:hypothetical protein